MEGNLIMSDNNKIVAEEIVKQLKENKFIATDESNIENQIANGTIKESDWKLIFEQQIKNMEKQNNNETK